MSFFGDLFGGANQAAGAQEAAITAGLNAATNDIETGNQGIVTDYNNAINFTQPNWQAGQQGLSQLGDLLGLNGAPGSQNAQAALATMPGYQATLEAGANATNASAAKNGMLNSGNAAIALQQNAGKIANQNFQNYASDLDPYIGLATNSAGQMGNILTGMGNQLSSNDNLLAQLSMQGEAAMGAAQANADLANQQSAGGILSGGLNLLTGILGGL